MLPYRRSIATRDAGVGRSLSSKPGWDEADYLFVDAATIGLVVGKELELVSKLSYGDKHTSDMDKYVEHRSFSLITSDQSTEATQPPDIASFVSPQLSPILSLGFLPIFVKGTDQVNASLGQAITQGIRVGGSIINQSWKPIARYFEHDWCLERSGIGFLGRKSCPVNKKPLFYDSTEE